MLVETHSLTKRYPEVTALDNCTMQIERGEVFGLLGPNGAGKSTLIRLLMGFLRPSDGWAKIDGLDSYQNSVEVHQRVTYLPGDVRLFRSMKAKRLLRFFCDVRRTGNFPRALEIADQLDLNVNTRVSGMSTGMRQKLALAATLSAETPLVILDEPTANLDPNIRSRVSQMVRDARDAGRTVLFSSHVLSEVEETCDRVAILRSGKLVHLQVVSDLRRTHRIAATLEGQLPEVPKEFAGELTIEQASKGQVAMETPGKLKPLLGWLATLPISEVHIEPVGLRAIYDQFHPPGENVGRENVRTSSQSATKSSEPANEVHS